MCPRRFGYNTRTGEFDSFLSMSHTLFFKAGVHLKAVLTLFITWPFCQYLVHVSSNAKLIPLVKTLTNALRFCVKFLGILGNVGEN